MSGSKLSEAFFRRPDVVAIARELLGKHLFTRIDSRRMCGGIIVEAEAYAGPVDRASHAYNNRRTQRTEVMFHDGGVAYVYLCYGMHHLFNIVTNRDGIPHAVLIRAIEPTHGIDIMLKRRRKPRVDATLTAGPGAMAQALGITTRLSGESVTGTRIWLEDRGYQPETIAAVPRVGVDYAGPCAHRPWRFCIRDNPWVSRR